MVCVYEKPSFAARNSVLGRCLGRDGEGEAVTSAENLALRRFLRHDRHHLIRARHQRLHLKRVLIRASRQEVGEKDDKFSSKAKLSTSNATVRAMRNEFVTCGIRSESGKTN